MIEWLSIVTTENTVPYHNLALEEYLLEHVEQGQCILYLWQNRHTVVIGKNQNAWKECRVSRLERAGGFLARRISGGGAVFHDLGNLNFTFVTKKEDYDIERQTEVILCAVKKLGIQAEKNGRNDITVDGRKFSGNAYYQSGENCFHHGTLLLHVNKSDMTEYLNVSAEKLKSKGVDSVKSRVANLEEFLPSVTVALMKKTLVESFEECYGMKAMMMEDSQIDWGEVRNREEKFSSWEWNYGRKLSFDYCLDKKFDWGEVQIQLQANLGCITEARIYSDALDTDFFKKAELVLKGVIYQPKSVCSVVEAIKAENDLQRSMKHDLEELFAQVI